MYIGSFLKNLFKPRKILCSIYFLLNLVVIFLVFGYVAPLTLQSSDTASFVVNGLVGLAVNLVVMLIALSPLGEAYVRLKEKAKKMLRTADNEAIFAIFDEVYAAAKAKFPKLGDKVNLYYKDSDEVNAYALGHRTVIVTRGLLECMDADRIRGVLAHEFGHIASGDSDLKLGVSVSNSILLVFTVLLNLAIILIAAIFGLLSRRVQYLFQAAGIFVVTLVFTLWVKLGMLLVNATSRKDEYAADAFAVDCGYGDQLYAALDTLDGVKTKSSFFSLFSSTHPDTVDRLAAIKTRLAA